MLPRRAVARAGLAVATFLLVLAMLRWEPVYAQPPWPVRALPLAGIALLLAVAAALFAGESRPRSPRPLRAAVVLLLGSALALALVVRVRGAVGLPGEVSGPSGPVAVLPPGPVEVNGPVLRPLELPALRRWTFRWDGPVRVSRAGTYRLWVEGRGQVAITLDGWPVLEAQGDPLRAGRDVGLAAGPHRLVVELHRTGPGPRLRLGWTRPDGYTEAIPPRALGPASSRLLWRLTDLLALALAVSVAALVWLLPWDRPRVLAVARAVSAREAGLSLLGHAGLVALMSWPLVLHPAAQGVTDRPDGRLNAWILAWDVHALAHVPTRLFDAPIFHPLPDSLAFSENLIVPAVLGAPALALGGPVFGYNVVLLLSLVVSGLGAQLLARRFTDDRLAAFVGGAFFAVGPHRWIRLAHLHAQVTLFLPFALLAAEAFWRRRRWRDALLVGLLLALQALSSIYLGAVTLLVLAVAIVAMAVGGLRGREWLRLLAGLLLAAALVAPVARPYLRMRAFQGVEWSLEDVGTYATTLDSYAASGTRLYGAISQRHLDPERIRDTLFPGVVAVVLGLVGLVSAPRRLRVVALGASILAVVISLGPDTAIYRFLHEHLVLVRGLRALSRFSLVPILALSVLGALALSGRRKMAAVALTLFLLESSNVPIRYAPAPRPDPAQSWLAGRDGAAAVLPLGEDDTRAMLEGVPAFPRLLNGDSGFVPRPYTRAMERLDGPLSEDALRLLRAVGVRYLIAWDERPLPLAARFAFRGDERVYEVPTGDAAGVPVEGTPVATLWSSAGVTVDLGRVGEVSRVVFEPNEAPWLERPTLYVSEDGTTWRPVEATSSLADATLSLYRDPRRGRGEVQFPPVRGRYFRLDPRLPAAPGSLEFHPPSGPVPAASGAR